MKNLVKHLKIVSLRILTYIFRRERTILIITKCLLIPIKKTLVAKVKKISGFIEDFLYS